MKEYIMLIITVSFFCGIIKLISPKSSSSDGLNFVIKIVIMFVVILPAVNFITSFIGNEKNTVIIKNDEHTIYNEDTSTLLPKILSQRIACQIKDDLQAVYGIKSDVTVPYSLIDGSMVFGTVTVTADCEKEEQKKAQEYINTHYSLECSFNKGDVND